MKYFTGNILIIYSLKELIASEWPDKIKDAVAFIFAVDTIGGQQNLHQE